MSKAAYPLLPPSDPGAERAYLGAVLIDSKRVTDLLPPQVFAGPGHRAIAAAIHELKNSEKEVFLLRTSAGLSFEEAANALHIPVGTAKTRMRAALIHLRQSLKHFAPADIRWTPGWGTEEGRQAR